MKARKSTVYIDRARGRRLGEKSNRYARTQKSSNSLILFRCSNSCFLLETNIAGHRRLLVAKWHPKAEEKLRRQPFFDIADRHDKLYGRSRLDASAQGRHETYCRCSFTFSSLSFDISMKNRVERWSSDIQGLFRVKIRKMALGSNDLPTLPLIPKPLEIEKEIVREVARGDKPYLRKSTDRKAQIRTAFVQLSGLICALRSVDFLR